MENMLKVFRALLVCGILLSGCQEAVALTYRIHPLVYNNGYELTGGTITTDGTLGKIQPENIVSYTATVTGPISYTFDSSSSSVFVFDDVVATPTQIVVPVRETIGIDVNGSLLHAQLQKCQLVHPVQLCNHGLTRIPSLVLRPLPRGQL